MDKSYNANVEMKSEESSFPCCNFDTCKQCNVKYNEKCEDFDAFIKKCEERNGVMRTMLYELLMKKDLTIQGKMFTCESYLKWGYDVIKPVTIHFINDSEFSGFLYSNKDEIKVFFSRERLTKDLALFNVSTYIFGNKNKYDKNDSNQLKILTQDCVFEEFVHDMTGFMISYEDILQSAAT